MEPPTTKTNLSILEERCGPLCRFDKPIILGKGEFMGHVTARVIFSHFTSQENDPQVNCSSLFTLEDVTPVPGEKSTTCHIDENISRRKTCCIEPAFSIHGFPPHPQQHGEKIITGLCEFSSLGQFSRPHRYHWKIGTSTMPVPA